MMPLNAHRIRGCAVSILARRGAFGAARYDFWRGEALSGLRGVDSGASGRFRGCAVSIHGRIVDSGAARRLRGRCAVSILARRRAFGAARYGFSRGGSLSAAKLRPLVFTCLTCLNTRNENVKTKRFLSFLATKRSTACRRSAKCLGTCAARSKAVHHQSAGISARSRAISDEKFCGREKFSKFSVRDSP